MGRGPVLEGNAACRERRGKKIRGRPRITYAERGRHHNAGGYQHAKGTKTHGDSREKDALTPFSGPHKGARMTARFGVHTGYRVETLFGTRKALSAPEGKKDQPARTQEKRARD